MTILEVLKNKEVKQKAITITKFLGGENK